MIGLVECSRARENGSSTVRLGSFFLYGGFFGRLWLRVVNSIDTTRRILMFETV